MRLAPLALASLLAAGCSAVAPRADDGTRYATAPDGVRIAFEDRGQGEPALLFVHGWCCDREIWRAQLDSLARDHRVVALDLAGHGRSGHERATWTIAGLADDVVAVADALDLRRIVLIGHSMGGPVALAAAARLPGRVEAVVGVDTLHDAEFEFPRPLFEQIAGRFEADFEATLRDGVRTMVPREAGPGVSDWICARALATDRAAALALMRDFPNVDLKPLFAGAGVPVRCINTATRPDAPPPHTNVETNRKYADFDAVFLEGVGHYPMLSRPAAFEAALRQTLAALGAG